jgi:signal peptidase I
MSRRRKGGKEGGKLEGKGAVAAPAVRDKVQSPRSTQSDAAGVVAPYPRPPWNSYAFLRENLESLIIAIILAIIIRHFAVEAFEIPTGSMAPTLFGMHSWIQCPNCPTEFNVSVDTNKETGKVEESAFRPTLVCDGHGGSTAPCGLKLHKAESPLSRVVCSACGQSFSGGAKDYRTTRAKDLRVECPHCHLRYVAVIERNNVYGGHKILVDKLAYVLGKPERFDVIVFGFDQCKNYIKRLIGLPGETIDVFDGDIYVNGKVLRKTDHPYVQDVLWRKVSDSELIERGLNPVFAWREVGARGLPSWQRFEDQRWSLNHEASEVPAALEYQRGTSGTLVYNANRPGAAAGIGIGDRKLAFTVVPASGKGWVGVELRDGDFTFLLRIPLGKASPENPAVLERIENEPTDATPPAPSEDAPDGVPPAEARPFLWPRRPHESALTALSPHGQALRATAEAALPLDRPSRIEIEIVDDRVTVRLGTPGNVETVLSLDYVSCPDLSKPPVPDGRLPQVLRILGAGVRANIESIQVYQDNYYTNRQNHADPRMVLPRTLGEDEFLAMGDNSASSSDGRYWGHVPGKNLMGKALLIFWPGWPGNFQCRIIR